MIERETKDSPKSKHSQTKGDVTIRTASNTLDLRGNNINEAKELSMDFFAKKVSSKTIFLLHGHGGKICAYLFQLL